MTEETIKKYFDDEVSADQLAADLKNTQVRTGHDTTTVYVNQIKGPGGYTVSRYHLLKLCNDVINGHLSMTDLNSVAFGLITSDYFQWDNSTKDGEIVAETLFDWDNPEINFPLTNENLLLWKQYLETGEYLLGS